MAATVVRHRKLANGTYSLLVNLDESKTVDVLNSKGEVVGQDPDPAYLREFTWGPAPEGVKNADWEETQLRETKLLLEEEAAATRASKLKSEGQAL